MEKLCDHHKEIRELCRHLTDSEGMHINQIRRLLLHELGPASLKEYYRCAEENCTLDIIYSLFSYFKLFKDLKIFQEFINSERCPVVLLENFIIYLMGFCTEIGENREAFFDRFLYYLSQEKYVQLLSESEFLYRDVDFFIYAFTKLENQYIERLLGSSRNIRQVLTDIFLNFPEERIGKILSRNPEMFKYIIMYLGQDGKKAEAKDFVQKYSSIIEGAKSLQNVTDRILEFTKSSSDGAMDRGSRIQYLIREILKTKDPIQTLSVLEYNRCFLDDFEKELISRLLYDTSFRNLFDFSGTNPREHTRFDFAGFII